MQVEIKKLDKEIMKYKVEVGERRKVHLKSTLSDEESDEDVHVK